MRRWGWGVALVAGLFALVLAVSVPAPAATPSFAVLTAVGSLRANAHPLAGEAVSGQVYVFVRPEFTVKDVRFFIDDPSMSALPYATDKRLPFDLGGTAGSGAALPFATSTLADGPHTLTAAVDIKGGGTAIASAAFTVANAGPRLLLDSSQAVLAATSGGVATGDVVDVSGSGGGSGALSVTTDAAWLTATPESGSFPAQVSLTADPNGLDAGEYTAMVSFAAAGEAGATLPVTLYVRPNAAPDQIHLSIAGDPATTLTVTWRTYAAASTSTVEYRLAGQNAWLTASGTDLASGADGQLHTATITGLQPATGYEYRVLGDGGVWSDVYQTATMPAVTGAPLTVVYVADTGIVGRPDGLAAGTQDVIDAIEALHPNLILLGGDFASRYTDSRYPDSIDSAIDAWFAQMQPLLSTIPGMPAWGNHEVQLGATCCKEGYAPWAARFVTPQGAGGSETYSFTIAGAHFVEIFAAKTGGGVPSAELSWAGKDMAAAKAAHDTWIIPFFHVTAFSDGSDHPSDLKLRSQLGPKFEADGVKVVLQAHDQAYERTWPLVGVPSAITETTHALTCYTGSDGVTWTTSSPGGKLSDQNAGFSQWLDATPPSWEAVRDNTMYHFAVLQITASDLDFSEYGIPATGGAASPIDQFRYTTGSC